jgi:hypothetical protein
MSGVKYNVFFGVFAIQVSIDFTWMTSFIVGQCFEFWVLVMVCIGWVTFDEVAMHNLIAEIGAFVRQIRQRIVVE